MRNVDSLPSGVDWQCELVTIEGDIKDVDGNVMKEVVELWFRNPLECIQELINNPQFRDVMQYAPLRHFVDQLGQTRVVDEMWTADWWWDMQVSTRCIEARDSGKTYRHLPSGTSSARSYDSTCHTFIRQDEALAIPRR